MGTTGEFQQCQRIQVDKDPQSRSVSITLERFDAVLGWYTAGALTIPLCQLPLLEQAIQGLSSCNAAECALGCSKIVPFPLLERASPAMAQGAG